MQPPVVSPVTIGGLFEGFRAMVRPAGPVEARLEALLCSRFDARAALLTDSGTSALALAMAGTGEKHRTIALPAWSCPDLLTAALQSRSRVRLYDLDPVTLSPDMDSLSAAIDRGVDAVVIAHWFGYSADIEQAAALTSARNVVLIEDAAQAAGGRLHGRTLGSFGDIVVLSFGRGKGMTGGGGGALVVRNAQIVSDPIPGGGAGAFAAAATVAQWLMAHPAVYAIPAALPFLGLGHTNYEDPGEVRSISRFSAALAANAVVRVDSEAAARARMAGRIMQEGAGFIRPVTGAHPGFLRLALRRPGASPDPRLGILASYPRTLVEYPVSSQLILPHEKAGSGAAELRDSLFTIPTHHRLRERDLDRIRRWLGSST